MTQTQIATYAKIAASMGYTLRIHPVLGTWCADRCTPEPTGYSRRIWRLLRKLNR